MSVQTLEAVKTSFLPDLEVTVSKLSATVRPDLPFTTLRVKADRQLSDAESKRLFALVDYLWATVVRGQSLKQLDSTKRSVVVNADSSRSFSSKPLERMEEFVDRLPAFVKEGSPVRKTRGGTRLVEGIPDINVSLWLDKVRTV